MVTLVRNQPREFKMARNGARRIVRANGFEPLTAPHRPTSKLKCGTV